MIKSSHKAIACKGDGIICFCCSRSILAYNNYGSFSFYFNYYVFRWASYGPGTT